MVTRPVWLVLASLCACQLLPLPLPPDGGNGATSAGHTSTGASGSSGSAGLTGGESGTSGATSAGGSSGPATTGSNASSTATGGGGSSTTGGGSSGTGGGSSGQTGASSTAGTTSAAETSAGASTTGAASTGGTSTSSGATGGSSSATSSGGSTGGSSGTTGGPTLTNLELWFEADSLVDAGLANGSQVGTWTNLSGTVNATSQTPGTSPPTLVTGALNGLPIVHFTSSSLSDLVLGATFSPSSYTIVACGAETGTRLIFLGGGYDFFGPSGSDILLRGDSSGNESGLTLPWTSDSNGHVFSATLSSSGTGQVWVDGVSVGSGSVPTPYFSQIGCRNEGTTDPPGQCSDGDIAAIFLYGSALSDTQRQATEAYLQSKYAVP